MSIHSLIRSVKSKTYFVVTEWEGEDQKTTMICPTEYAYRHIRITLYGVGFRALRSSSLKIFSEFFTRS